MTSTVLKNLQAKAVPTIAKNLTKLRPKLKMKV